MHRYTAIELRDLFLKGSLTASAITRHFLNRIETYDKEIGAFLHVMKERALAKAEELDKRYAAGETFGPMAAIPIAIKDNIHIEGELTTCASKFLANYRAPFSATATRLLEEADAILIGKTNLDEFAMGSSTEHSAFQLTRNPWDLTCVPGGSSGGSAAAVAARLVPIALGSDTGGSIRQPASFCGIVGFKPTYGRVSRYGLVAFASSLDQIGPFAASVSDAALTMEVIGCSCERDSTSIPSAPEKYLDAIDCDVGKLKLGVPHSFLAELSAESREVFNNALEVYKKRGAEVIDIDLDILKHSIAVYYILATAEASTNLARFDGIRYGIRPPQAKTLREVYELSKEEGFGAEVKRRILLGTYVLSAGYQDAYYKKAQKVRTLIIRKFQDAFNKCDVIALPVCPGGAFRKGSIKDPVQMYLEDLYTISSNLAGLPAISIPAGFNGEGLPMGLQLIAPQQQDVKLLAIADAFTQTTHYHKALPKEIQ